MGRGKDEQDQSMGVGQILRCVVDLPSRELIVHCGWTQSMLDRGRCAPWSTPWRGCPVVCQPNTLDWALVATPTWWKRWVSSPSSSCLLTFIEPSGKGHMLVACSLALSFPLLRDTKITESRTQRIFCIKGLSKCYSSKVQFNTILPITRIRRAPTSWLAKSYC